MATATRKLFVNWTTKTLQVSDLNGSPFTLPAFGKYENIPFDVVIVEPDLTSPGLLKFSRVPIANLSLAMSLNDTVDDSSPLASQNTFTKNTTANVFSGSLNLNTSGLNTWIGSLVDGTAYFEIEVTEGSNVQKIYVASVTVKQSVAPTGATTPSPVDDYYTKAQVESQFLKPVSSAGVMHTILSPSGTYQRIIGVDDGGNVIDQVLPV
jgi:hypothetical protein